MLSMQDPKDSRRLPYGRLEQEQTHVRRETMQTLQGVRIDRSRRTNASERQPGVDLICTQCSNDVVASAQAYLLLYTTYITDAVSAS